MGCINEKPVSKPANGLKVNGRKSSQNEKILEAKVVFLGDAGVGKSSICQRYVNNRINETYEVTIGGAYLQQKVTLKNGSTLRLHLWDTGGEERFKAMTPLYYRDANAAILVYDVSDMKTFRSLEDWVKELDSKVKQDNLTLVMAANKCDIDNESKKVSYEMAKKFADNNNMFFFELSALKGTGIADMFKNMSEEIAKMLPAINAQK